MADAFKLDEGKFLRDSISDGPVDMVKVLAGPAYVDPRNTFAEPSDPATRLFNKLPTTIRIGAHDYRIVKLSRLESEQRQVAAEFRPIVGEITLAFNVLPTRMADALLHEALHGLFRHTALNNDGVSEFREESVVSHLAEGLTSLFRDNPWLTGWLAEAVR